MRRVKAVWRLVFWNVRLKTINQSAYLSILSIDNDILRNSAVSCLTFEKADCTIFARSVGWSTPALILFLWIISSFPVSILLLLRGPNIVLLQLFSSFSLSVLLLKCQSIYKSSVLFTWCCNWYIYCWTTTTPSKTRYKVQLNYSAMSSDDNLWPLCRGFQKWTCSEKVILLWRFTWSK